MKICGIIAEYDPFHNGHAYLIQKMREKADGIVVLMSGHAMQRGEISRFDKWTRAKAALLNGADVVLELPAVYSASCAERFASAAITLFSKLGGIDTIGFGSESGDEKKLAALAEKCLQADASSEMKKWIKKGYSYPRARQEIVQDAALVNSPNNLLGMEYIKASLRLQAPFSFATVKRKGSEHKGEKNASFLRCHPKEMAPFIPERTHSLYTNFSKKEPLETIFLYRLRTMEKEDFLKLPDVTEGLENRLHYYARRAQSLEEFLHLVKSKRYTYSRLKRIALYAVLGIKKEDLKQEPAYVRILGCTPKGRTFLSQRTSSPLFCSPDFAEINKRFPKISEFDRRATELFSLAAVSPFPCGRDFSEKPIILSEEDGFPA